MILPQVAEIRAFCALFPHRTDRIALISGDDGANFLVAYLCIASWQHQLLNWKWPPSRFAHIPFKAEVAYKTAGGRGYL